MINGPSSPLRVAVVGAGISGMACALELERHGISPHVFEMRPRVGLVFSLVGATLQMFSRPRRDEFEYLRREYHISLAPLAPWRRVDMRAPNKRAVVEGKLGYFFLRGRDAGSIQNQLAAGLRTPVFYSCRADPLALARAYDYVVVASGDIQTAQIFGSWQNMATAWVHGATVLGDFDPNALIMWLNTNFSKSIYAYLVPFNSRRASLVNIVQARTREEGDQYWQRFLEIARPPGRISLEFNMVHHVGRMYPHQVGNILFAGIAGGFLEQFLGFGLVPCLKSGVLAARAIVTGQSYEELLRPLNHELDRVAVLRELLQPVDNDTLDRLVWLLGLPGVRHLVYNTNIDVMKYGAPFWRLFYNIKGFLRHYRQQVRNP